eukprot:TRINITY_DN10014_c0_g1_i2.p1 TRINITY_DN10014_c0_g1~~TRINITY_DN10014_c0_g1_i2.p1  ORF type:complete len:243 (-),score=49.28 TRINITY_DN10014_c0_g1_i2:170-898(-)
MFYIILSVSYYVFFFDTLFGLLEYFLFFFFFFQAEDGIRDHAQSRGLGDVYKRQVYSQQFQNQFKSNKLFYRTAKFEDFINFKNDLEQGGFVVACSTIPGSYYHNLLYRLKHRLALMMVNNVICDNDIIITSASEQKEIFKSYYEKYDNQDQISRNLISSLFAWSKALYYRGMKDKNKELLYFCQHLDNSIIEILEKEFVTKDIAEIKNDQQLMSKQVTDEQFLKLIENKLVNKYKNFLYYF